MSVCGLYGLCVSVCAHARLPTLVQGFERPSCRPPTARLLCDCVKGIFFFFFLFTRAYICIYKCFLSPFFLKKKKRFYRLYNIHIPQVYYIKSSPFEPLFTKISRQLVVRVPCKTLRSYRPCAQFCRTFPATTFVRVSLSVSHSF